MSESEEEVVLKINKAYAEKYDTWRRKEEYQQLIDKYGEDALEKLEGTSSSSEEEDDDAQEITPEFEEQFLKALAAVRNQDPKMYDKGVDLFPEKKANTSEGTATTGKTKKSKPMYLKDYERKIIVEKGGKFSDDDEDEEGPLQEDERPASPTYVEEQLQIKSSFKDALKDSSDESSDEETFLTQKRKTKEEKEREEEEYIEWLKGERETLKNEDTRNKAKGVESLREYWSNPQLDEGEKFLRDYILDKAYKPDSGDENQFDDLSDEDLSEDDRLLDEQEEFERKYNFRFEEPDSEFIKSYPRNVAGSLRKKDTSRAKKRQEVKERKEKEKQKMREELKKLKNLKKMEIMEKLDKLKKVTGNATVGFEEEDMKGEFDPDQHDRMMQKVFDEQYDEYDEDATKPVFDDEEFDEENWDEWTGYGNEQTYEGGYHGDGETLDNSQLHCEDPGFNMDADYDPSLHKKEKKDKRKKKKDKKNKTVEPSKTDTLLSELDSRRQRHKHTSEFAKALQNERPVFDPDDKTFEDYFDEYYRLDYEDLIGDLPCRFKYRTVVANDFGLSTEEVLGADDKELNRWAALRKTCQYRTTNEEMSDLSAFREKGRNRFKKEQILQSFYNPRDEGDELQDMEVEEESTTEDPVPAVSTPNTKERKRRRHKDIEEHQKDKQNVANEIPRGDAQEGEMKANVNFTNSEHLELDLVESERKIKKKKKHRKEKVIDSEDNLMGENDTASKTNEGDQTNENLAISHSGKLSGNRRQKDQSGKARESHLNSGQLEHIPEHLEEKAESKRKGSRDQGIARKVSDHDRKRGNKGSNQKRTDQMDVSNGKKNKLSKKERRWKDQTGKAKDSHLNSSPYERIPEHLEEKQESKRRDQGRTGKVSDRDKKRDDDDDKVSTQKRTGQMDDSSGKKNNKVRGEKRTGLMKDHVRETVNDYLSDQDEVSEQDALSKRARKKKLIEELRERKRRKMAKRKEISDARLRAYGIRPTAYKYKLIQERIKNKHRGKAV